MPNQPANPTLDNPQEDSPVEVLEATIPTPAAANRPANPAPSLSPFGLNPAAGTDDGDDAGLGSPRPSEQLPEPGQLKSGSSRTSSRGGSRRQRELLTELVAVTFEAVTAEAHERLVRDQFSREAELLLADEQDVTGISQPAGSLLNSRLPDLGLVGEVEDLADLVVALGGYLVKQGRKFLKARKARKHATRAAEDAGLVEHPEPEPQEPPAGAHTPGVGLPMFG